jgi:hypothetical protein
MKITMLALKKLLADYPTLVTFGLGLAITLIIGAAIGTLDHQQAAFALPSKHIPCGPWVSSKYCDY